MSRILKTVKFLLLPLLIYAFWEINQAIKFGSLFIKWHTHLMLYVYLWVLSIAILYFVSKVSTIKNYINLQIMLTTFWSILFLIETLLVGLGIMDTYMEKIKYGYVSRYNSNYETYYRNHTPYEVFYISRPEFNHERKCNSLGFSDIEWSTEKKPKEKRILVLGDSFTEGVGAPFDSNYVSILRIMYAATDTTVTLMNAGISGDDPCVNFVCYRDLLLKYKPDVIVQTLSANDMNTDIATKGGLERFKKGGKVKFEEGHWWEPVYALSYVSRLFFSALGYNELLIKTPFSAEEKKTLDFKAIDLFKEYSKLAKEQQAVLMVAIQPDQSTLYNREYEYNLDTIACRISTMENVTVVNLLPFYLHYFEGKRDSIKSYYWIQDGHHNSKGYELMAKAVKYNLDSIGQIKTAKATN